MIVDTISHLSRYAGLGKHFGTAAAFFSEHDPAALPSGRTEVDGENVFINTATNRLDRKEMAWEAHAEYADIQLILEGEERFGWSDRAEMDTLDPTRDFRTCRAEPQMEFTLSAGQFVIFLPGEPHAPGNPTGRPADCRKAVIKVRCGSEEEKKG
ncbi:MAG: YhcH/YjgK/YiaL family protein [Clostridia bacterium]|nr:YhcH/YjgK/YiaL family protein [Clostridia bacterium]